MLRQNRYSSVIAAMALVLGSMVGVLATAPAASANGYEPAPGVKFNNPKGDRQARRAIVDHIVNSIYGVAPGGQIKVMSWNIRERAIVQALIDVHQGARRASVQVLMQASNAVAHEPDPENPIAAPGERNLEWERLSRALNTPLPNPNPTPSFARVCYSSCRGGSGIAHVKMMTISQVSTTPHVVIYTSGNFTGASANIQWNDGFTLTHNPALYHFSNMRFDEMARDRRMANPYAVGRSGGVEMQFFPFYGAGATGDPIMKALRPVRCRGAAAGFGTRYGRTIIRISQTAITDARGRRVAWRLRELKGKGCNVRVLYSLMGGDVKRILRGGRVPMHQLATDFDGDLVYDRYLHQKTLVINGKYGANPRTAWAWNGTANIQGYTLASDEILGLTVHRAHARAYQWFVDSWWGRRARYARTASGSTLRVASGSSTTSTDTTEDNVDEAAARRRGINPYAKFQAN